MSLCKTDYEAHILHLAVHHHYSHTLGGIGVEFSIDKAME